MSKTPNIITNPYPNLITMALILLNLFYNMGWNWFLVLAPSLWWLYVLAAFLAFVFGVATVAIAVVILATIIALPFVILAGFVVLIFGVKK